MTPQKYPRGWNEARVQRVLEFYESQTDEEVADEIEAGFERTTMEVRRALVPVVRGLIANRKSSHIKKTHNTLQPPIRARRKSKSQRGSRAARG